MRLVVKADTFGIVYTIAVTLVADFLLIFFGIQDNTLLGSGITALVISLFVALSCIIDVNQKLIIDGDSLCYHGVRKKHYSIDNIKGLHIVNAQIAVSKTLTGWNLKDKYVIIYLKDRDFEWQSHQGSVDFWKWHRKHILFTTVYDEKAVEYFKSKGIGVTRVI